MASSSRSRTESEDTTVHLNDLVSLPIIVTDFDAELDHEKKSDDNRTPGRTPLSESTSPSSEASLQKWATGFNEFADDMWKSMTKAMRLKLRQAVVEVLKRTDGAKTDAGGSLSGEWEDDARMLD